VLRQSSDPLGGNAAYVTEDDGTYYYLAHVAGFVPGQVSGQKVRIGDVIAYVGNSGDAAGGPTHVHFEVHPKGGGPVDPKPYLDRWLADALANVPNVLTAILGPQTGAAAAGPTPATPAQRLITTDEGMFEAPAVPARSQLLWASSASPAGGALQLAAAEATEAAQSVDWAAERTRRAAAAGAWARSMATARAQVAPLMPAALRPMLGPEGIGP